MYEEEYPEKQSKNFFRRTKKKNKKEKVNKIKPLEDRKARNNNKIDYLKEAEELLEDEYDMDYEDNELIKMIDYERGFL
jgi:hypothetical protein